MKAFLLSSSPAHEYLVSFFCSFFSPSATSPSSTHFAQDPAGLEAASPVCVARHVGECGGEVDELAEAADEIHAHEGILGRTEGREPRP